MTQRHQVRRERVARELERREALYAQFIEQSAGLFLDSLDKDLDDPARLVAIGAVVARIRLTADLEVSKAAESVMHEIFASYHRPPVAPKEIFAQTRETFTDPLSGFTQACRAERDAMLKAL